MWKPDRSPGINFEQYLRREALLKIPRRSSGDWMKLTAYSPAISAARSSGCSAPGTTNARSTRRGHGSRLTLAIAYATEAHLFITT